MTVTTVRHFSDVEKVNSERAYYSNIFFHFHFQRWEECINRTFLLGGPDDFTVQIKWGLSFRMAALRGSQTMQSTFEKTFFTQCLVELTYYLHDF